MTYPFIDLEENITVWDNFMDSDPKFWNSSEIPTGQLWEVWQARYVNCNPSHILEFKNEAAKTAFLLRFR